MPGFGMGFGQCQRQVQALSQRLQQKLVLAQQLIMTLNAGDPYCKEAFFEQLALEKYGKILEKNTFFHISQFIDFLQEEAKKTEHKPELAPGKAPSDSFREKLCLPDLAKILGDMCQLWHNEIYLAEGEKITGINFAKQLLELSANIASVAQQPSETWKEFLESMGKSQGAEDEKTNFISKFWPFLFRKKESGSDLAAAINIHGYLCELFSLTDLGLIFNTLEEETKDLDGLTTVEPYLENMDEQPALPNLLTYLKIICQYIRYGKGSSHEYPLAPTPLKQLLTSAELIQQINASQNLPQIITWLILTGFEFSANQQEAIVAHFDKILNDKDFQKSRDDKRLLWRGLNIFARSRPAEYLLHFFRLPQNAKQLSKGLQAIELSYLRNYQQNLTDYPTEATTIEELIDYLNNKSRAHYKKILGFTDEDMDLLMQDNVWRLVNRNNLLNMCLTYASLCQSNNYERGAQIISEVLKQAMRKSFLKWRYSEEQNHDQIKDLDSLNAWCETHILNMILGITDSLRQKIGSINRAAELVAQRWEKVLGYSIEDSRFVERSYEIETKLRDPQTSAEERKTLGMEMGRIKRDFSSVELIKEMLRVTPEGLGLLKDAERFLIALTKKMNDEEATLAIEQMLVLIKKTDLEQVKTLRFEDSDKPYDLLQVGQNPVKTCQRWNEWGSYTDCLPAYVADSNKKVVWINSGYQVIGRSILRLLTIGFGTKDQDIIPLLILERPYSTAWTEQMATGLIKWLVGKAEKISADNGKPVMVAVNDKDLVSILQKALPKSKFKVRKLSFEIPRSQNEQEYADSMGGRIPSGAKINKLSFHTFLVGTPEE
jgi:hypothetical protein